MHFPRQPIFTFLLREMRVVQWQKWKEALVLVDLLFVISALERICLPTAVYLVSLAFSTRLK